MQRSDGDLERLAYESALRGLDMQERLLAELRARTGGLLAASSLVASFLGQRAFSHPQPRLVAFAALVAFVVSVRAGLFVLVPRTDLDFAVDGAALYDRLHAVRAETPEIYRRLMYELQALFSANDRKLPSIARLYNVSAGALIIETAAFAVLLGGELVR
jgi:hypothetical protein